jgi:hypothetical protein
LGAFATFGPGSLKIPVGRMGTALPGVQGVILAIGAIIMFWYVGTLFGGVPPSVPLYWHLNPQRCSSGLCSEPCGAGEGLGLPSSDISVHIFIQVHYLHGTWNFFFHISHRP